MKVLYFCEGYTDVRFVAGLAEVCDLTLAVPSRQFRESGLAARLAERGTRVEIDEIAGGRAAFQWRSFVYLLRRMRGFDVVLSLEMGRGSLNATVAGALLGVPVVTYLGTSPVEYFACRRIRGQIGGLTAAAGTLFLRTAMRICARLSTAVVTTGPYLRDMAAPMTNRAVEGFYCGIDTALFRPVNCDERRKLRERHRLPADRFLILFSSRMSHEKDPETVLQAVHLARVRGVDAVVLNLGGGHEDFTRLARNLKLPGADEWVMGRSAVHPMHDLCEYVQAADVLVQASLAEGGGMSPLEAVACGTPAIATAVGGLARTLPGIAQLTPRRDPAAMADAICWVAAHPREARAQAMHGRAFVEATWSRARAFATLRGVLLEACARPA